MLDRDERLVRWCAGHRGVISLAQAAALGLDDRWMHRRVEAGLLVRRFDGVYVHRAVGDTFETSLAAAVLAAGPGAFVAGPSLMRIHGVRGSWSEEPELVLLGAKHVPLPGVRVRRIDRLGPRDTTLRLGFPALAPALGLLLLGATHGGQKVQTAVHDMVFLGFTTRGRCIDVLRRYEGPGRRGVVTFRRAVRSLDPKGRATQTNLELTVLNAVRAAGLPEPHLQFPVVDGDGRKRRLDLAWPEVRLDLETDGDRWHLSGPDRSAMAVRDAALRAVGFEVIRVDSGQVETDLSATIRRLHAFFGA